MRKLIGILLTVLLVMVGSIAYGAWQPSGPIKVLIGFRAGGGADTMARLIAEDIHAEYGWTILPKNVTGGGGAVMARELKKTPADGLTFGVGIVDTFAYGILASRSPGYSMDDFDFLTSIAGTQMAVVAKSEKGWKTFSDVINAAKSGQKISFGTMTHRLADGAYYIGKVNGVDFNIVSSYKGGKAVLNAINADDIDVGWVAGPQKSGVESGDLINLVNGEDTPLKVSPDSQKLTDIGVDFTFGVTITTFAPDGLPPEAKQALIDAVKTVVEKEGSKSNTFINNAFVQKVIAGDELTAYVKKQLADSKELLDATAD